MNTKVTTALFFTLNGNLVNNPPIMEPILNAAKKVDIKNAQTITEEPK